MLLALANAALKRATGHSSDELMSWRYYEDDKTAAPAAAAADDDDDPEDSSR
jgi:hypothetical protein